MRTLLRFVPASFALLAAALASSRAVDAQTIDQGEEVFAKIDPYTRNRDTALERAGYVSLGPFPLAEGVRTSDVEETLGTRVLWVETAHFHIGSTLHTYKLQNDAREERQLKAELERLSDKLERVRPLQNKIDAWLRLHLYAQRVEEEYAAFLVRFGIRDKDFASAPPADPAARKPYLGQPWKPTVLLTEKMSQLGRFQQRWLKGESNTVARVRLPGGVQFIGTSAEVWQAAELPLDSTLHCAVVHVLALNLLEAFCGPHNDAPMWLQHGFAYTCARRIDERWNVYAPESVRVSATRNDAWKWEPRVRGLVTNRFVTPWKDMLAWQRIQDLKAPDHMIVWSRMSWIFEQKDADLHALLLALTRFFVVTPTPRRTILSVDEQAEALSKAFGKSPEELDEAWRRFVLRTYEQN